MAHLSFIKESKSRDCWKQGARDMSLEWFHHSVLHNSSFTFILFFLQFLWQKSNTVKGIKTTPWKTNVPIWIGAAIRQNIAAWLCSSLRKIHPIIPAWIYIFGLPNRMPCIILVGGDILPLGRWWRLASWSLILCTHVTDDHIHWQNICHLVDCQVHPSGFAIRPKQEKEDLI